MENLRRYYIAIKRFNEAMSAELELELLLFELRVRKRRVS
uniref:Uncharacterized protein n=1 Tax=Utricularia reniformis TaxID=192314 RepID=A0A1Y0B357_9LAMI|nr:hypothetical protein AEK19_MT1640 [Utricularia reniformis]ART31824.1 hypothetical protein AEK19_MT1640 [Utricularia reniformis]